MSGSRNQLAFCVMEQTPTKKLLQSFRRDAGWSVQRSESNRVIPPHSRVQWVCVERQGVKIGIARLELAPPEFCYVSELVIKSKFRGKGAGRFLLGNIEAHCLSFQIKRLLLEPAVGTKPFYESLSYVPDPFVASFLKKELRLLATTRF